MRQLYRLLYSFCQKSLSFLRAAVSVALFPDECTLCGNIAYGVPLCRKCRAALKEEASESVMRSRCVVCGKPLLSETEVCLQCRTEDAPAKKLDGIRPVFPYLLTKKKLLYTWKIAGCKPLTPFFADCMHKMYSHEFDGLPLVPVPPRPGKIREKGWDQTKSLAKQFRHLYGVEVLDYLVRTSGLQQKKLGRKERLSRKAQYSASRKLLHEKKENIPRHVVLLDDVMTTGSTLCSCAAVLKAYGVQKVSALTLFTVPA